MGTYLIDTFTDTNGTLLTAHTIPTKRGSQVWAHSASFGGGGSGGSSVTIQSNQCQFAASQDTITTDPGVTDCVIEFNWIISGTTGHRLAIPFRYTDIDNHYYLNLREPNDDWTLYKIASGAQTTVATGAKTFNTSTTYAVKIVISGTSVQAYIDGVDLTGSRTMDAHLSSTKLGLGVASIATNVTCDSFTVTNGVTPTVASAADIIPGSNRALTFNGFVAAPSTITVNGVTEAFTGTPTTSAGTMLAIPRSDFRFGGHHAATRFSQNVTLQVSDGIDSASVTIQVDPEQAGNFGARSATAQSATPDGTIIDLGTWNSGAITLATGDEVYGHLVSGDGAFNAPEVNYEAYTSEVVWEITYYDISAGSWSGLTTVTFEESDLGFVARRHQTAIYVGV